jgi:hypothetical protein
MKRGKKKINFSNRFIFFLITLGILGILAGGVYAISSSGPNSGHPASDIDFSAGISNAGSIASTTQVSSPKYCIGSSCITAWPSAGTSSQWTTSGSSIYFSSGKVGIGITNPQTLLDVETGRGYSYNGIGAAIVGVGPPDYTNAGVYGEGNANIVNGASAGVTNYGIYGLGTGNNGVGVYGSGTIGVKGDSPTKDFYSPHNTYASGSSIRWKDNITEINPQIALNKVLQINGDYFNWKIYNNSHDLGFIAEQIGQIVPEVVQYETDMSSSSKYYFLPNGTKQPYAESVDYGKLTPILVEAIKGQQQIITSQNQKISKLQTAICKLDKTNSTGVC